MELSAVQYVSDQKGQTKSVLIPIELWKQIQQIIENQENHSQQSNAWDTLETLTGSLDAPADWSAEHDHYLYGTAKRDIPSS